MFRKIHLSVAVAAATVLGLVTNLALMPQVAASSKTVTSARASSGVVKIEDSKTNCIYTGSDTWMAGLQAAEVATGIKYNCIETFTNADLTWAVWTNPWVTRAGHSFGIEEWLAADRTKRTVILTQQLIPDSVCTSTCGDVLKWEAVCDAGRYDGYAKQLARRLVATGFGSSVIRLGAEMNGSWENDYAGSTGIEQRDWAKCFAQEVTTMRAVKGAHFLFDWNVNACAEDDRLPKLYPGNAYVDIIGIDAYNGYCFANSPTVGSTAAFKSLAAEPDGLNVVTAFARAHHKPMSLPEWGNVLPSSSSIGDDGSYVLGIHSWVDKNDVAFQSYFDSGGDGVLPLDSSNPNTLATYIESFG
jgi:hypothetical protein